MRQKKFAFLIWTSAIITIYSLIILNTESIFLIDIQTRNFIESLADTWLYDLFGLITKMGSRNILILFILVIGSLLIVQYKRYIEAVYFTIGVTLTWLINNLIKIYVKRGRPMISVELDAVGYSFPSGHAMISFVTYALAAFFLARLFVKRKNKLFIKMVFYFLIIIIGFSRVILNVHFLTDVLVGFLFGYLFYFWWVSLYNICYGLTKNS